MKEKLPAPELVAAFVEEYQVEMNRLAKETQQQTTFLHQERAGIDRKIEGIMRAAEDRTYSPIMKDRMRARETRRDEIDELVSPASPPA